MDSTFLRRLRLVSLIEGVSTLVLFFVAMPLKYVAGYPLAVTIFGSLHGVLFLVLVMMYLQARKRVPISNGLVAAGIAAAVLPFGPFVVDAWLQ